MFLDISIHIIYPGLRNINTINKINSLQGNIRYKFYITGTLQFTCMFIRVWKFVIANNDDAKLIFSSLDVHIPIGLLNLSNIMSHHYYNRVISKFTKSPGVCRDGKPFSSISLFCTFPACS